MAGGAGIARDYRQYPPVRNGQAKTHGIEPRQAPAYLVGKCCQPVRDEDFSGKLAHAACFALELGVEELGTHAAWSLPL